MKIIDRDNSFTFLRKLSENTDKIGNREVWNLTQQGSGFIKESALKAGIQEWRNKMIMPIRARKVRKGSYKITIPWIIARLDIMQPHYVALKRGRLITQWAQERFGTKVITGLSRVSKGPRGGIKGAIFVNRYPFIENGFRKMVNRADMVAQKIANKIVRSK